MASQTGEELYVSVGRPVYRDGKAKVLQGQESLLKIMKHFANLKLLWKEKKLLRNKVAKMLNEAVNEVNSANAHMPVPKAIAKRMEAKKREEERILRQQKKEEERIRQATKKKAETKKSKARSIDDELAAIQEKLRSLNAAA